MSPLIFHCIICGQAIYDPHELDEGSWLNHFRVVYTDKGTVHVSGVGLYRNSRGGGYVAPLEQHASWHHNDLQGVDRIPVMRQSPRNGRHGFVLHGDCWLLLNEAFELEPLPLRRILEICQSLPFPLWWDGVDWGHDYGALVRLDDQSHYPWEDRLEEVPDKSDIHRNALLSPYEELVIPRILSGTTEHPRNSVTCSYTGDCFMGLPWEVRELVATSLPITDALSLRLASRSFAQLLTSQTFWASRFMPDRERGYVFEARKGQKGIDWIKLYQHTGSVYASPRLHNRRRTWKLIQTIKQYLKLRLSERLDAIPFGDHHLELRWTRVLGDFSERNSIYSTESTNGRQAFNKSWAYVPEALAKIAISVIPAGDADYIAGMRLIDTKGHDIQLGYRSESREVVVDVTYLKGFAASVGPCGIRALKILRVDGTSPAWIGRLQSAPVIEALSCTDRVVALEVSFDGYKLVALAVAEAQTAAEKIQRSAKSSLRSTASWFPAIPDQELHLNETSFIGESPSTSGYRPLPWILFGGCNGDRLSTITGVAVQCRGILGSIEFAHATDQDDKQKLGRRRTPDPSEVLHFAIDGPGGEIITKLATSVKRIDEEGVYSFLRHGSLSSFKLTTNWGRSYHFRPTQTEYLLKDMDVAPGTTIVGLYGGQHPVAGLVSLGVISASVARDAVRERMEDREISLSVAL